MFNFLSKLLLIFAAASLSGIAVAENDDRLTKRPLPNNIESAAFNIENWSQGNKCFTTALYPYMNESHNFVFSPISLQLGLSMVAELAYGETREELLTFLSIPKSSNIRRTGVELLMKSLNTPMFRRLPGENVTPTHQLSFANGAWLSDQLVAPESFEYLVQYSYLTDFQYADFLNHSSSVRRNINQWVSQRTYDLIPELMPEDSITENSKLVLINTLYMSAPWAAPFDPSQTYEAPFYGLEKSLKPIPYMHRIGQYGFLDEGDYIVTELPFAGCFGSDNNLSLFIVAPSEGYLLDEIEAKFDAKLMNHWIANVTPQWIDLSLPKFKVTSKVNAKELLINMGMARPFSNNAEFALDGDGKVSITDLVHEAVFEATESGVTAAAGTGTSIGLTSIGDEPKEVLINRPFLFFVIEKTEGIVLFNGRIMQPAHN